MSGIPGHIPFDLIEGHIAGEISEGDRARLEAWAAVNPDNMRLLNEMTAEWANGPERGKYDVDKAWKRLKSSAREARRTSDVFTEGMEMFAPPVTATANTSNAALNIQVNRGVSQRVSKWMSMRVALGIAAVLVIGIVGIKYTTDTVSHLPSPVSPKTYTTTPGQRASITLSDGSRVTLAPATTMIVSGRRVDLRGEALFTVTQHTSTPFSVIANGTTTRVLGTTFGIRTYDNQVRVAVAEGKVQVEDAVLATGDVATVTPGIRPDVSHGENVSAMLAWAQGRLAFHLTPLRDMIPDLERWYDIKVDVQDERLLDRKLTITLTDESPVQVARVIGLALGVRANVVGKVMVVY